MWRADGCARFHRRSERGQRSSATAAAPRNLPLALACCLAPVVPKAPPPLPPASKSVQSAMTNPGRRVGRGNCRGAPARGVKAGARAGLSRPDPNKQPAMLSIEWWPNTMGHVTVAWVQLLRLAAALRRSRAG